MIGYRYFAALYDDDGGYFKLEIQLVPVWSTGDCRDTPKPTS
jgi:hypothetical protein